MKILLISPQVPIPPTDGGKLSIYGIMKYLSKRGHTIDFVAYRKGTDYNRSYEELKAFCSPHILDVQTENNIRYVCLNLFSEVPYNISKYKTKELKKHIISFLENNRPDIIQITNLHMGWIIEVIKKYTNIPVVLRQENLEMLIMKRFYEYQTNPIIRKYAKLQFNKFMKYEPELCEKFDTCIMISDNDSQKLISLNSKIKTSVIPVGVESSLLKNKKGATKPYSLVHIGSLDWLPNFDSLNWFINNIFPSICREQKATKLYVYGSGDTSRLRIPNEVEKNIVIEGFVEDIWKAISDKALLVVPLRIGSGIRVKILEMLAFGQSLITTSIGKEGIKALDNEHLIIADTKEEFISKTLDFFNRKYDIARMMMAGKKLIAENYTWEKIAEQFEKLYLHLRNNKT